MDTESICPVCEKTATKTCSSCHSVSYCSVEHQKSDWKVHKKSCRLYEVKCNEKFGRYTVASRDIPAGTIIMSESAIMVGPKQDTLPTCLGCHKKLCETPKKYYCSKCLIFPMCGPECEKIPIHAENECKIFAQYRPVFKPIQNFDEGHPAYECILTIRCLLLKEKDPKRWKKLTNMQHQNETRKEQLPLLWKRNEVNTVRLLRDRCQMTQFSEEEIHSVLGYSDINSFEVKINQNEYSGLFDNTFIMAHDCISNTHHTFTEDFKMVVRASLPIKKGEYITTTYAHTLEGTLERQADLSDSKFFDCTCDRCSDPTEFGTYFSALKCQKCSKGYLLSTNSICHYSAWSCSDSNCKFQMRSEDVLNVTRKVKEEIEAIRKDANVIQNLEGLLKKHRGTTLHPNHFLIIDMESSLLSLYGRIKGWLIKELSLAQLEHKEALCRHVLEVLDVIEPGLSRIRGVTLYEMHAAIYFAATLKFQRKKITPKVLKMKLLEVLKILEEAKTILSFDTTSTAEGTIAKSIPSSIKQIMDTLATL